MIKTLSIKTTLLTVFIIVIGLAAYAKHVGWHSSATKKVVEKLEAVIKKKNLQEEWVNEEIKAMSLREKVGQFFMVAAYSNKGEKHFKEIDSLISKENIGGLIFFQGQRSNLVPAISRFQTNNNYKNS